MSPDDRAAAQELLMAVEDYAIAFVVTLLERRAGQSAPVKPEVRDRVLDALEVVVRRADR